MAQGFNINARLQLQGPYNLRPVVEQIRQGLNNVNIPINASLNPAVTRSVTAAVNAIGNLENSLGSVRKQANEANRAFATIGTGAAASGFVTLDKNVKNTIKSLQVLETHIGGSVSEMQKFGQQAGLAGRRFLAFTASAVAFIKVTSAIRDGVTEAFKFEREMIRLQQVGGDTASTIKDIESNIRGLSKGLGVSSSELANVATTLRQAGLAAGEVNQALSAIAKTTLAPTFKSVENTTEGVIAMRQQFNIAGKDIEKALGSINTVAAAFAVEAEDLVEAIRRAGGAFKAASGDFTAPEQAFKQMLGLFTSVRQTTRESAESIATGFRTIFARLQSNTVSKNLREMGINLRFTGEEAKLSGQNIEGHFVGAYEAINRLSKSIKDIPSTDPRFSAIVEQIGGIRQVSRVLPLLQQFSVAQRAVGIATSGTTSLTREADKAQAAFITKLAKTREVFLDLVSAFTQNKGLQTFLDGIIKITQAATTLVKAFEPLIPLLTVFATVKIGQSLGQFSKGVYQKFGQSGTNYLGRNRGGPVGLNTGGVVPGLGSSDSQLAYMPTGGYVIRKQAAKNIGYGNLANMAAQHRATGGRSKQTLVKLTPGEFCFDEGTARKIGYRKLDKLNKYYQGGSVAAGQKLVSTDKPAMREMLVRSSPGGDQQRLLLAQQRAMKMKALRGQDSTYGQALYPGYATGGRLSNQESALIRLLKKTGLSRSRVSTDTPTTLDPSEASLIAMIGGQASGRKRLPYFGRGVFDRASTKPATSAAGDILSSMGALQGRRGGSRAASPETSFLRNIKKSGLRGFGRAFSPEFGANSLAGESTLSTSEAAFIKMIGTRERGKKKFPYFGRGVFDTKRGFAAGDTHSNFLKSISGLAGFGNVPKSFWKGHAKGGPIYSAYDSPVPNTFYQLAGHKLNEEELGSLSDVGLGGIDFNSNFGKLHRQSLKDVTRDFYIGEPPKGSLIGGFYRSADRSVHYDNKDRNPSRRVQTLAHELTHALDHQDAIRVLGKNFSSSFGSNVSRSGLYRHTKKLEPFINRVGTLNAPVYQNRPKDFLATEVLAHSVGLFARQKLISDNPLQYEGAKNIFKHFGKEGFEAERTVSDKIIPYLQKTFGYASGGKVKGYALGGLFAGLDDPFADHDEFIKSLREPPVTKKIPGHVQDLLKRTGLGGIDFEKTFNTFDELPGKSPLLTGNLGLYGVHDKSIRIRKGASDTGVHELIHAIDHYAGEQTTGNKYQLASNIPGHPFEEAAMKGKEYFESNKYISDLYNKNSHSINSEYLARAIGDRSHSIGVLGLAKSSANKGDFETSRLLYNRITRNNSPIYRTKPVLKAFLPEALKLLPAKGYALGGRIPKQVQRALQSLYGSDINFGSFAKYKTKANFNDDPLFKDAGALYDPDARTVTTRKDLQGDILPLIGHEYGHAIDFEAGRFVGQDKYASQTKGHKFEQIARLAQSAVFNKDPGRAQFYAEHGVKDVRHEALAAAIEHYGAYQQAQAGLRTPTAFHSDKDTQRVFSLIEQHVLPHAAALSGAIAPPPTIGSKLRRAAGRFLGLGTGSSRAAAAPKSNVHSHIESLNAAQEQRYSALKKSLPLGLPSQDFHAILASQEHTRDLAPAGTKGYEPDTIQAVLEKYENLAKQQAQPRTTNIAGTTDPVEGPSHLTDPAHITAYNAFRQSVPKGTSKDMFERALAGIGEEHLASKFNRGKRALPTEQAEALLYGSTLHGTSNVESLDVDPASIRRGFGSTEPEEVKPIVEAKPLSILERVQDALTSRNIGDEAGYRDKAKVAKEILSPSEYKQFNELHKKVTTKKPKPGEAVSPTARAQQAKSLITYSKNKPVPQEVIDYLQQGEGFRKTGKVSERQVRRLHSLANQAALTGQLELPSTDPQGILPKLKGSEEYLARHKAVGSILGQHGYELGSPTVQENLARSVGAVNPVTAAPPKPKRVRGPRVKKETAIAPTIRPEIDDTALLSSIQRPQSAEVFGAVTPPPSPDVIDPLAHGYGLSQERARAARNRPKKPPFLVPKRPRVNEEEAVARLIATNHPQYKSLSDIEAKLQRAKDENRKFIVGRDAPYEESQAVRAVAERLGVKVQSNRLGVSHPDFAGPIFTKEKRGPGRPKGSTSGPRVPRGPGGGGGGGGGDNSEVIRLLKAIAANTGKAIGSIDSLKGTWAQAAKARGAGSPGAAATATVTRRARKARLGIGSDVKEPLALEGPKDYTPEDVYAVDTYGAATRTKQDTSYEARRYEEGRAEGQVPLRTHDLSPLDFDAPPDRKKQQEVDDFFKQIGTKGDYSHGASLFGGGRNLPPIGAGPTNDVYPLVGEGEREPNTISSKQVQDLAKAHTITEVDFGDDSIREAPHQSKISSEIQRQLTQNDLIFNQRTAEFEAPRSGRHIPTGLDKRGVPTYAPRGVRGTDFRRAKAAEIRRQRQANPRFNADKFVGGFGIAVEGAVQPSVSVSEENLAKIQAYAQSVSGETKEGYPFTQTIYGPDKPRRRAKPRGLFGKAIAGYRQADVAGRAEGLRHLGRRHVEEAPQISDDLLNLVQSVNPNVDINAITPLLEKLQQSQPKSKLGKALGGKFGIGAVVAGALAPAAISHFTGTIGEAKTPGQRQAAVAGQAVGGLISGATTGAGLGSFLGPIGTAIGGVVGGLGGLADSLRAANSEISAIDFEKSFNKATTSIENVLSGKTKFTPQAVTDVHRGLTAVDKKIALEAPSLATNAGGLFSAPKEYASREFAGLLDIFSSAHGVSSSYGARQKQSLLASRANASKQALANELLPHVPALQGFGERIAAETRLTPNLLATRTASGRDELTPAQLEQNRKARVDALKQAGVGPIAQKIAAATGVSVRSIIASFDKVAVEANKERIARESLTKAINTQEIQVKSFTRITDAVDSAIGSFDNLQRGTNALASQFEGNLTAFNVKSHVAGASNIGGLDTGAHEEALQYVTNSLGGVGSNRLLSKFTSQSRGVNQAAGVLPEIINKAASQSGLEGAGIVENINSGLQDANIPEEIRTTLERVLDGIKPEELAKLASENVQKLSDTLISTGFAHVNEILENAAKQLEQRANAFNQGLIQNQSMITKIGEGYDQYYELQINAARSESKLVSERTGFPSSAGVSLATLQQPFQLRQERLTGFSGANAVDPTVIGEALRNVNENIGTAQKEYDRADGQAQDQAAQRLVELQGSAQRLTQALGHLANSADRNATIQEKINALEEDRQSRLGFTEKLITADPQQRFQIARNAQLTNVAARQGHLGGFSPEAAQGVLEHLSSLGQARLPDFGNAVASDVRQRLLLNTGKLFNFGGAPIINQQTENQRLGLIGQQAGNDKVAVSAQDEILKNQETLQGKFFENLKNIQKDFFDKLRSHLLEAQKRDLTTQLGVAQGDLQKTSRASQAADIFNQRGVSFQAARRIGGNADLGKLEENLKSQQTLDQDFKNLSEALRGENIGGKIAAAGQITPEIENTVTGLISEHIGVANQAEVSNKLLTPLSENVDGQSAGKINQTLHDLLFGDEGLKRQRQKALFIQQNKLEGSIGRDTFGADAANHIGDIRDFARNRTELGNRVSALGDFQTNAELQRKKQAEQLRVEQLQKATTETNAGLASLQPVAQPKPGDIQLAQVVPGAKPIPVTTPTTGVVVPKPAVPIPPYAVAQAGFAQPRATAEKFDKVTKSIDNVNNANKGLAQGINNARQGLKPLNDLGRTAQNTNNAMQVAQRGVTNLAASTVVATTDISNATTKLLEIANKEQKPGAAAPKLQQNKPGGFNIFGRPVARPRDFFPNFQPPVILPRQAQGFAAPDILDINPRNVLHPGALRKRQAAVRAARAAAAAGKPAPQPDQPGNAPGLKSVPPAPEEVRPPKQGGDVDVFGQNVQGLGNVIAGFNQSITNMSNTLQNLSVVFSNMNIPEKITLERSGKIEVVLNGAQVLAAIEGDLKEVLTNEILTQVKASLPGMLRDVPPVVA